MKPLSFSTSAQNCLSPLSTARTPVSGAEPWASAFVDYSPRADVTLRLEVNNLTARSAWSERDVHAGLRHVADLVYAERRDEESYRNVRLSVRKAFN